MKESNQDIYFDCMEKSIYFTTDPFNLIQHPFDYLTELL